MISESLSRISSYGQTVAIFFFATTGLALLAVSLLAFAGVLPWLHLEVSYLEKSVPWAGQAFQIGMTVLFLLLAVYVPTNRHIMMLEATHRNFAIGMDDVARAYQAVHLADRKTSFEMEREFDAVRERFEYLKSHPDLPEIDGELLTIAAQMSHQSRDLAKDFSEERIARAQNSLRERQRDVGELEERIVAANALSIEIRRGLEDVEFAENSASSQLMRLREELAELEARIAGNDARKGRHLRSIGETAS